SKAAQTDLPEGLLGSMSQRMRPLINSGQFAEGLNAGVERFVSAVAEKLAVDPADLNKTQETAGATSSESEPSTLKPPSGTRPRLAKATGEGTTTVKPASTEVTPPSIEPTPAPVASKRPSVEPTPAPVASKPPSVEPTPAPKPLVSDASSSA